MSPSIYPIEIDVARAIASGQGRDGRHLGCRRGLNAKHAQEQAGATKAATLELLRRNSREAAAAVREFTDERVGPGGTPSR